MAAMCSPACAWAGTGGGTGRAEANAEAAVPRCRFVSGEVCGAGAGGSVCRAAPGGPRAGTGREARPRGPRVRV